MNYEKFSSLVVSTFGFIKRYFLSITAIDNKISEAVRLRCS